MNRQRSPYQIHKRPTKKSRKKYIYYARFLDGETGKYRSAVSTLCSNRDDAVRWCENQLHQKSNDTAPKPIGFTEYSEGFWQMDSRYAKARLTRGYSVSPIYLETARLNTKKHLIPKWGKCSLNQILPGAIEEWTIDLKNREENPLAPATVNKLLQTLSLILDQAVADGHISTNPAKVVKPLRNNPVERGTLSEAQIRKLLTDDKLWPDTTHQLINVIFATTGIRMGELRALTVDSVTPTSIKVQHSWLNKHGVAQPKCGSTRTIPICPAVYALIQKHISTNQPEHLLFPAKGNKDVPISTSWIERQFQRALTSMDIDRQQQRESELVCHSYRHSLNTLLHAKGVSESKIRAIMGHRSSRDIQETYTHLRSSDFSELVALQNALLGVKPKRNQKSVA